MLNSNNRQGIYGVVYLRAIAIQGGFPIIVTEPGEDFFAVDATINFIGTPVRVQVKTTSTNNAVTSTKDLKFRATKKWISNWEESNLPVYLVYVVLPKNSKDWLEHTNVDTILKSTHAYWCKLNHGIFRDSNTINIPRANRLRVETLEYWRDEALIPFGGKK